MRLCTPWPANIWFLTLADLPFHGPIPNKYGYRPDLNRISAIVDLQCPAAVTSLWFVHVLSKVHSEICRNKCASVHLDRLKFGSLHWPIYRFMAKYLTNMDIALSWTESCLSCSCDESDSLICSRTTKVHSEGCRNICTSLRLNRLKLGCLELEHWPNYELDCFPSQVIILLSTRGFTGHLFTKPTDRPSTMTMTSIELEEQEIAAPLYTQTG